MRTTLNIDDDVFEAARGMAELEHRSIGDMVSQLLRKSLQPVTPGSKSKYGLPVLSNREDASPVTMELVNRLRDKNPE